MKPVTLTIPLLTVVALPKPADVKMPMLPPTAPNATPPAGKVREAVLTVPSTLTVPALVVVALLPPRAMPETIAGAAAATSAVV